MYESYIVSGFLVHFFILVLLLSTLGNNKHAVYQAFCLHANSSTQFSFFQQPATEFLYFRETTEIYFVGINKMFPPFDLFTLNCPSFRKPKYYSNSHKTQMLQNFILSLFYLIFRSDTEGNLATWNHATSLLFSAQKQYTRQ